MRSRGTTFALGALLASFAVAACAGTRTASAPGTPPSQAATAATAGSAPAADRSQAPLPGPAPALKVPPQHHFTLANGLRVRLVENHKLPVVALNLVVDAGAVHDPPAKPGLASFTAALLTEGTKTRDATRISDDLGFLGASLAAGSGFDSASLSGSSLVVHLDALLSIFADVLVNPSFPQGDFARVQDARLVSLVQQRDVAGAVAAKAFARLYWGGHPYGHWLMGTETSVRAIARDDLVRFHAERWKPDVSELVVVGDVTEGALSARLEKALAGWTGKARPDPAPAPAAPPGLQTVLIEKRGAPQAFVMLGMPGLERASPDYVTAEVAFQVLGGGSASRLFRNLREKQGYTYGIYSRGESRKLGGTSFVVGNVRADAAGLAMKALLDELALMAREPVTPGELAVARNALLLSLPAEFASVGGIASKLAAEVVHGLPDDYWDHYAAEVAKVSAADVQRVARKVLDASRLTTVMVCDIAAVRPQLEGLPLGKIEVRGAGGAEGGAGGTPGESHRPRSP